MDLNIIKNFRNLFLWQVINKVISITYFSILTIKLGPYNYGLLALVLATYEIASIGFIGVNNALQRYISEKKQKSVLIHSLGFAFSFSVIVSILLFIFKDFISFISGQDLSVFIPFLVIVLVISSFKEVLANGLFGVKNFKSYIYVEVVYNILKLFIVSALIFLGMGVIGVLLGLTVSALFASIVALLYLKNVKFSTEKFNVNKLFSYSLKFTFISLIYQIQPQIFIFFLSRMDGVLSVGYYKFFLNLVLIAVVMLPQTLSLLIFPYVSELVYKKSKVKLSHLFNGSFKLAFYMSIFLSLIFYALSGVVVRNFFNYYSTALIFVPLFLLFSVVQSLGFISATLMKATDSLFFYIKLTLVVFIISLISTPILIKLFGVGGAILSYTIIMFLITFVLTFKMTRKAGIEFKVLPSKNDFVLMKRLVKVFLKI